MIFSFFFSQNAFLRKNCNYFIRIQNVELTRVSLRLQICWEHFYAVSEQVGRIIHRPRHSVPRKATASREPICARYPWNSWKRESWRWHRVLSTTDTKQLVCTQQHIPLRVPSILPDSCNVRWNHPQSCPDSHQCLCRSQRSWIVLAGRDLACLTSQGLATKLHWTIAFELVWSFCSKFNTN